LPFLPARSVHRANAQGAPSRKIFLPPRALKYQSPVVRITTVGRDYFEWVAIERTKNQPFHGRVIEETVIPADAVARRDQGITARQTPVRVRHTARTPSIFRWRSIFALPKTNNASNQAVPEEKDPVIAGCLRVNRIIFFFGDGPKNNKRGHL